MVIIVIIIFVLLLKDGLNHIKGRAKGPKHKKAIIILEVLKYHFFGGFLSGIFMLCSCLISLSPDGYYMKNYTLVLKPCQKQYSLIRVKIAGLAFTYPV
ncbi:MAG: hypothetical protein ABIH18_04450 [Candidatus Omnitrophota bacterium]